MAEALVHLQRSTSIAPYSLWQIEIPDALIQASPTLPAEWRTKPALTREIGDSWLKGKRGVAMLVPSAVVPGENNCLINPEHLDFQVSWVLPGPIPFNFDARLTSP